MAIPVTVLDTEATVTVLQSFEDFQAAASHFSPLSDGSATLTVLPEDIRERVLGLEAHYHHEANESHWLLKRSVRPPSEPPAEVVQASEQMGFVDGLLARIGSVIGGDSVDISYTVTMSLPLETWWSDELPVASKIKTKFSGVVSSLTTRSWRFAEGEPVDRLVFAIAVKDDKFLAALSASIKTRLTKHVLGELEEAAWKKLQGFISPAKKKASHGRARKR